MSDNTQVRITEEDKERIEQIKDEFQYTEPSNSEVITYILDAYFEEAKAGAETPTGVTRQSAGGNSTEKQKAEKEVEDRVNSVRIDDNGGTRNNEQARGDGEDQSFPDDDEEDVATLDANELGARVER